MSAPAFDEIDHESGSGPKGVTNDQSALHGDEAGTVVGFAGGIAGAQLEEP